MKRNWPARAALAVILLATMTPAGSGLGARPGPAFCLACGSRGLADALANIVLFAPLGVALALGRRGVVRPVVSGALLSLTIEVVQHFVPGRDPNLADVFTNTVGTAVGVLLARTSHRWLRPAPQHASRLSRASVALALGLLLGVGPLLAPTLPETTYYGQWTARFENMAHYEGRIVAASVGGVPIASERVHDSDALRRHMAEGAEVRIDAVAGPPPDGLAPIFSIFDDQLREIFLLGVEGEVVVVRHRTRAVELRLDQANLIVPDALHGIEAGDPLRLRFWRSGREYCLEVNDRRSCDLGFGLEDGWSVIYFDGSFPLPLRGLLGLGWLAGLFVPAGFWLRRRRDAVIAVGGAVVGLAVIPVMTGLLPTSVAGYLAALAGIGGGVGLCRVVHPRLRDRDRARIPSPIS